MLPWEGDLAWSFEALSGERASKWQRAAVAARAACVLVFRKERKEERQKLEKLAVPLKRNLYTLRNFYRRN
jgi:hypothetical protein